MLKKFFIVVILLISASNIYANTGTKFTCNDLVKTWQGHTSIGNIGLTIWQVGSREYIHVVNNDAPSDLLFSGADFNCGYPLYSDELTANFLSFDNSDNLTVKMFRPHQIEIKGFISNQIITGMLNEKNKIR